MKQQRPIGTFMDPFVDFSFKRLFGMEANTDILLSFLNALLKDRMQIVSVTHLNPDRPGKSSHKRKTIFDLYCITDTGERIIIELQRASQRWFKHRSLFYSSVAIQDQDVKGDWDFYLNPVYVVCLMNFCFDDTRADMMVHEVGLINKSTQEVFNDRLHFIYIEMPKFHKQEAELKEEIDYWFYIFRHLSSLEEIPLILKDKEIYKKVFQIAEFTNLTPEEMNIYDVRQKERWDRYSELTSAKYYGREEGLKEGLDKGLKEGLHHKQIEVARLMKKAGEPVEKITIYTGLSIVEIEKIED